MTPEIEKKIFAIERPCSKLVVLYFLNSLAALIAFPVVFATLFCKYITLRYQFDNEGVSASWGVFFRRQVYLTYGRIQDIHLNRSFIERWLGIGTVEVQTASGSSTAELSIVGLEEFEEIRDFLYTKMRGFKESSSQPAEEVETSSNEFLETLHEIRDELRMLRESLSKGNSDHV